MVDHYFEYHVQRLIKATNDLWREKDSICVKCHDMAGKMNCLLCYCPRYHMGTECGGDFVIHANGVKDCSRCVRPHDPVFAEEFLKARIKMGEG